MVAASSAILFIGSRELMGVLLNIALASFSVLLRSVSSKLFKAPKKSRIVNCAYAFLTASTCQPCFFKISVVIGVILDRLGAAELGGTLPDTVAQEVEFGAADEGELFHLDFRDDWSVEGEDFLYPDRTSGDFADDEGRIIFGMDRDHDTLEDLDTGFVTLFDVLVDADGVADVEGNIVVCS